MAAVDYQAKYEAFLRGVLKDIETKVQTAQQNAEESSKGESGLLAKEVNQIKAQTRGTGNSRSMSPA